MPERASQSGTARPIASLPSARAEAAAIARRCSGRTIALFLDYDGTLAEIATHPELALLDSAMRKTVSALAERCFVAVVSGRDLEDVRAKVGLEEIVYAGSHGFDIEGPAASHPGQTGEELLPALDAAEASLRQELADVSGLLLERKRYSLAVHVRQVAAAQQDRVAREVQKTLAVHPALALMRGKKVFELRPAVAWDKGQAVLWLMGFLAAGTEEILPIYVGDDVTDEDAFRALRGRGIGIVVGMQDRDSLADYALAGLDDVRAFLEFLLRLLEGEDATTAAAALAVS